MSATTQSQLTRRPWTPPAIEVVGPVADLTRGPKNGNLDNLVGSNGGFQVS